LAIIYYQLTIGYSKSQLMDSFAGGKMSLVKGSKKIAGTVFAFKYDLSIKRV
jgi:hypothetical protein